MNARADQPQEDPRINWGPGEWAEEVQRVDAENRRLRVAFREFIGDVSASVGRLRLDRHPEGTRLYPAVKNARKALDQRG